MEIIDMVVFHHIVDIVNQHVQHKVNKNKKRNLPSVHYLAQDKAGKPTAHLWKAPAPDNLY